MSRVINVKIVKHGCRVGALSRKFYEKFENNFYLFEKGNFLNQKKNEDFYKILPGKASFVKMDLKGTDAQIRGWEFFVEI